MHIPSDGGPGRTRTCNQTVMSGRISISLVEFAGFLVDFDRVSFRFVLVFLVRNWCGDFGPLREMDTTVFALAIIRRSGAADF